MHDGVSSQAVSVATILKQQQQWQTGAERTAAVRGTGVKRIRGNSRVQGGTSMALSDCHVASTALHGFSNRSRRVIMTHAD